MKNFRLFSVGTACLALSACGDPQPAATRSLTVVTAPLDTSAQVIDNAEIQIDSIQLLMADLHFLSAGEAHASQWQPLQSILIPAAHAHPGHNQGGAITGELPGRIEVIFSEESSRIGDAIVQLDTFESADFTFDVTAESPTAIQLQGTVSLGGQPAVPLVISIDPPIGRQLIGIPFDLRVDENEPRAVELVLSLNDTNGGTSLFDGVQWGTVLDELGTADALQLNAQTSGESAEQAYALIRQRLLSHNYYLFQRTP